MLAAFSLPQTIFEQSISALRQVVSEKQADALRAIPPELDALLVTTWDWLHQAPADDIQHQIMVLYESHCPEALLNLDDPPVMLYVLGVAIFKKNYHLTLNNIDLIASANVAFCPFIDIAKSLAVVGSRNPTAQGAASAR